MKRSLALLRVIAFLSVAALLIGFGVFSLRVAAMPYPGDDARADAIVVLTGDAGRIAEAAQLLEQGRAPRLLVSGVNRSVSDDALRRNTGLSRARFDCCVAIGREATDTAGNALETAAWAGANGYDRLIIVTSDYHLPRSLLELRARMPETELIAWPVRTAPPWRRPGAVRLWVQEYGKYLAILARNAVGLGGAED